MTADDLIDGDDFKITFDIYVVSYPASGSIHVMRPKDDTNNNIVIKLDTTADTVSAQRAGGGDIEYLSVAVSTGSWVSCEYQAKIVDGNDHYLKCGETEDEGDADHTSMLQSMDSITFGDEYGSGAGEYYLDNVKIYPSDKY